MPELVSPAIHWEKNEARTLVLSTGHLTKEDGKLLDKPEVPHLFANYEYGWILYLPQTVPEQAEAVTLWKNFSFSQAFIDLMQQLYARNYRYVIFDRDEEPLDGLPCYPW